MVFGCWNSVSPKVSTFVEAQNVPNYWGYWSTSTWGNLLSQGKTWEYLAGNWFSTVSPKTLTWSQVIEGSCPSV